MVGSIVGSPVVGEYLDVAHVGSTVVGEYWDGVYVGSSVVGEYVDGGHAYSKLLPFVMINNAYSTLLPFVWMYWLDLMCDVLVGSDVGSFKFDPFSKKSFVHSFEHWIPSINQTNFPQ